jgi:hypothetical protein
MDLDKELAELQDALAMTDFNEACSKSASRPEGLAYLIVKVLRPIKIKMDGNKNHKRPHVHIQHGTEYHAASYAIDTGKRLVGNSGYDKEVHEWIGKNRPKLLQAWGLMQAGKDAAPLAFELRGGQGGPLPCLPRPHKRTFGVALIYQVGNE